MNRFLRAQPFTLQVKNSRFLAEMTAAATPDEARAVAAAQRTRFADIRHCVFAFVVGKNAEVLGCSDDGEPSGTAGRPVLEVLKNSGMTDVVLTVLRWFGGTKLGTGGLVHAYSDSAKGVIATAECEAIRDMRGYSFTLPFAIAESAKRMLADVEFAVTESRYGADGLTVSGAIPAEKAPLLAQRLADISRGAVKLILPSEEE